MTWNVSLRSSREGNDSDSTTSDTFEEIYFFAFFKSISILLWSGIEFLRIGIQIVLFTVFESDDDISMIVSIGLRFFLILLMMNGPYHVL